MKKICVWLDPQKKVLEWSVCNQSGERQIACVFTHNGIKSRITTALNFLDHFIKEFKSSDKWAIYTKSLDQLHPFLLEHSASASLVAQIQMHYKPVLGKSPTSLAELERAACSPLFLIFDTETTGLMNDLRITELAWILKNRHGQEIETKNFVGNGSQAVDEFVARVSELDEMCFLGEFFVVAHNIDFDKRAVLSELKHKIGDPLFQSRQENVARVLKERGLCTMRLSTPICKIPKPSSKKSGVYKWPKNIELHKWLFPEKKIT